MLLMVIAQGSKLQPIQSLPFVTKTFVGVTNLQLVYEIKGLAVATFPLNFLKGKS